jgi:hypothetical protein
MSGDESEMVEKLIPEGFYDLRRQDFGMPESLSKNWVSKCFSLEGFDPNEPHTQNDWRDYYFSVSPEAQEVDLIPNPLVRANLHVKGLFTYLGRKRKRGLIIPVETEERTQ